MKNFWKSNFAVVENKYTPIAYTVASIALATHTHPIQAMKHIFSRESYLRSCTDVESCLATAKEITDEYNLPIYGEFGDMSEDPRLIGYMESIVTSLCELMDENDIELDEFNEFFSEERMWEFTACAGRSWVSNGEEWTKDYLLEEYEDWKQST